jgi:hypothetical protein
LTWNRSTAAAPQCRRRFPWRTIGQADAGAMSGGAYTLNGGFWVDFLGNKLMLPLILR